jgi:hypothetical protein
MLLPAEAKEVTERGRGDELVGWHAEQEHLPSECVQVGGGREERETEDQLHGNGAQRPDVDRRPELAL